MSFQLKTLKDEELIERLKTAVAFERKTTVEIIEYIKEIERRRLYLKLGHTSMFAYLTNGLGYTPASAQRRIDSARLMRELPEIKEDLEAGKLNLMQMSMVAQSVRQKQKESSQKISEDEKRGLLSKVKNQDMKSTQKILSQALDLKVEEYEKQRVQKDDSLRVELTLSKEQLEILTRVKEIISHQSPNPSWAELIAFLASEFVKCKDPLQKSGKNAGAVTTKEKSTSRMEVAPNQARSKRPAIPAAIKRETFQRDRCCQWKHPATGKVCGSRFQLQIDHKYPLWAGGGDEQSNRRPSLMIVAQPPRQKRV